MSYISILFPFHAEARTGSDAVYLEDEPRLSYLVIESQHVEWTATLEEAVPVVGD